MVEAVDDVTEVSPGVLTDELVVAWVAESSSPHAPERIKTSAASAPEPARRSLFLVPLDARWRNGAMGTSVAHGAARPGAARPARVL